MRIMPTKSGSSGTTCTAYGGKNLRDTCLVGGSFSARGSSAEVRRVFVHHIVEVEVVGQKEEQGDQRGGDEEEEVNG